MTTATLPEAAADNAAPDVLAIPPAMTIIPPAGELPDMFPADVQFAIITFSSHLGFQPKEGRDGFPSSAPGFPKAVVPGMVDVINRSEWARENGRWAVRSANGKLIILRGIDGKTRPVHSGELPVQAEPLAVSSKEEAQQIAEERNNARLQVALVPREWSFAVENPQFGKVDPLDSLDRGLRLGTLVPNPLRDELEEIHGPEMNRLEELLPEGFEIHNGESLVREGDVYRAATDDEAAAGRVEIETELPFDIRQPIAAQIAERLTEFSDELRETAAKLGVAETISLQDEHDAEIDAVCEAVAEILDLQIEAQPGWSYGDGGKKVLLPADDAKRFRLELDVPYLVDVTGDIRQQTAEALRSMAADMLQAANMLTEAATTDAAATGKGVAADEE